MLAIPQSIPLAGYRGKERSGSCGDQRSSYQYRPRPDQQGPAPNPLMDGETSAVKGAARLAATWTQRPRRRHADDRA